MTRLEAGAAWQGGKKGRGPKASARPPHDANKERLVYMLTCQGLRVSRKLLGVRPDWPVGHSEAEEWPDVGGQLPCLQHRRCCSFRLRQASWPGDISITLKTARQIPTGRGKSAEARGPHVL